MQRIISKSQGKRKESCHKMEKKLAAIVDEIDETTERIIYVMKTVHVRQTGHTKSVYQGVPTHVENVTLLIKNR